MEMHVHFPAWSLAFGQSGNHPCVSDWSGNNKAGKSGQVTTGKLRDHQRQGNKWTWTANG